MNRTFFRNSFSIFQILFRRNQLLKLKRPLSKLFLGACVGLYAYHITNFQMLIEDAQIVKLKKQLNKNIKNLKSQYGQMTVYPQIHYNLQGNTYIIQFQIDQRKCDLFLLFASFFSYYNSSQDKGYQMSDIKSLVHGDILTLYVDFQERDPQWKTPQKARLTITGIITNQRPNFRIIFQKDDFITDKNIQALCKCYHQAIKPKRQLDSLTHKNAQPNKNFRNFSQPQQHQQKKSPGELYKKLQQFGVTVFDPNDKTVQLDWDYLAGYQHQKRTIQDTILLALNYPQIYDQITENTRMKNQPNRPKAILFEGPPGTGKTTSAKIISQQVKIPLVYIPIQAIMNQFYGKSQRNLSEMWEICKKLGKVIIFIDEIDALAGSRSPLMHEASRRVLSTLLRKIDSFESTTNVMLICATNRKQDLDPAMLSRIDLSIQFNVPDMRSRSAIFHRYAKHLKEQDRLMLAQQTQGFSGRSISDICKHAQRRWASKLIRKQVNQKLPDLSEYIASLHQRKQSKLD